MSTTIETLTTDLTAAMKAHATFDRDVLRQMISAVRAEEKAGPVARELSSEDVLKVLAREVKKRRESVTIYTAAGAPERAAAEAAEADFIETYLPAQLTADELERLVREVIAEVGATTVKDMGAVMKAATTRAAGAADGKTLSALVRAALS